MSPYFYRYNKLLAVISRSLVDLVKALKGLVVMSSELELMANSLFINAVPDMWKAKARCLAFSLLYQTYICNNLTMTLHILVITVSSDMINNSQNISPHSPCPILCRLTPLWSPCLHGCLTSFRGSVSCRAGLRMASPLCSGSVASSSHRPSWRGHCRTLPAPHWSLLTP